MSRLRIGVLIASTTAVAALASGGALLARYWPRSDVMPTTLSVFEPHAGGCAWSRYDVVHRFAETVFRFPADCQGVQVSFSPSGREALVWFAPEGVAPKDVMLYRVDVDRGRAESLTLPDVGEPESYAIDRQGRVLAFTLDQEVTVVGEGAAPRVIAHQGREYATSTFPEGIDVLAHALTLDGDGSWRIVETRASRCCEGAAPGIGELALVAALRRDPDLRARQSSELLTTSGSFLSYRNVHDVDGRWMSYMQPGWTHQYVFKALDDNSPRATGSALLAREGSQKPLPQFGFEATDVVQLMAHEDSLLITAWATGTEPHVYDMRTGELTYSSKVAHAVTFWPSPPNSAATSAR